MAVLMMTVMMKTIPLVERRKRATMLLLVLLV
jgi:hypothetical protein